MGFRLHTAAAAVAAAIAAAAGGGCRETILFTSAPAIGPSPVHDSSAPLTPVFLGLPVDLSELVRLADAALPDRLPAIIEWVGAAACAREGRALRCTTAKVDIGIERAGRPTIVASRGDLTLEIPLRYELVGRGTGRAQHVAEAVSGELTASVDFAVELTPSFVPRIRLKDEVRLSSPVLAVLDGEVALAKHIGPRLRRSIGSAADALAMALAADITRDRVGRAWRALHAPVEINRELRQWLRAEPVQLVPGGFTAAEGGVALRVAILSRLQVFTGDRPSPLPPKPAPELSAGPDAHRTVLRLPAMLPWDGMLSAVREAFAPGETIRTAEVGGTPLGVAVRGLSFLPAREQLGIEFDLEIVEPEALRGRRGTAHAVATPVLRPAASRIELAQIGFPPGTARSRAAPTAGISSSAEAGVAAQLPRLPLAPFATKLGAAAQMDISHVLRDVLPHVNSLFERPLGSSFVLHGRFDAVSVSRVVPARQGFAITFDLEGALMLLPSAGQPERRDDESARDSAEQ